MESLSRGASPQPGPNRLLSAHILRGNLPPSHLSGGKRGGPSSWSSSSRGPSREFDTSRDRHPDGQARPAPPTSRPVPPGSRKRAGRARKASGCLRPARALPCAARAVLRQLAAKCGVSRSVVSDSLPSPVCHPSAHGVLQARTVEGVGFPFSRGSSRPRD